MKLALTAFAVCALSPAVSAAQQVTWPATKASVQGDWYGERSSTKITISGEKLILARKGDFETSWKQHTEGSTVATINDDFVPETVHYTAFTGTCFDYGNRPLKCNGKVSYPQVPDSPSRMSISLGSSD